MGWTKPNSGSIARRFGANALDNVREEARRIYEKKQQQAQRKKLAKSFLVSW
jgi:hypothetical protein